MYSRLNVFRFFLAWSVLAYHMNTLQVPLAGPIAVWCFFFISGFLVSNILYEQYAGRPKDFLTNRFLRIYPTYWAALSIGMALLLVDADGILKVNKAISLPQDFSGWVTNLLIFNLSEPPRIVPPAWSLAIELNWYLILFVASFFPKKWVLTFLYANLVLPFVIYFVLNERIYEPGAGFAFALGSIAYHSKFKAPRLFQHAALTALPIVMYVVPVALGFGWLKMAGPGVTFSLIGSVLLLFICMPLLTTGNESGRLSSFAGEISYPLFLTHHYAAWFAINWFGVVYYRSWSLVLVTTLISLVLSAVIVKLVDHPIANVRKRIRDRNKSLSEPQHGSAA